MISKYFCAGVFFFSGFVATAQDNNKYMIFFKDKKNCTFNPYDYFDAKAIERRTLQCLPLVDSTDFPVNENYIAAVSSLADSVSYSSRWFNALTVFANEISLQKILELKFVAGAEHLQQKLIPLENDKDEFRWTMNEQEQKILQQQTETLGIADFREATIDGKGIRIAIFDAGFPSVDVNPCFEHIRKDNRIIKTWDFGKNKESVYSFAAHGTQVFSCIAGRTDSTNIGLATGADFLLARTENALHESYSEEENWLAAAEWADKNGADIINSSLGYTVYRYFREEMNGKESLISRAANMAARKGMLVVSAAGNDGDNNWNFIATPADADSVLSVGGIDPETGIHITFSSFGPTADKRMKPNVSAFGKVIAAGKNSLVNTQGTSFASPLVAGFAACAWQSNRNLTNMELFREIEKSATLFPYYDYAHGYGIPQAKYFTSGESNTDPTFELKAEGKQVIATISAQYFDEKSADKFYYHIVNEEGSLDEYNVVKVTQQKVLELDAAYYDSGKKLVLFYKGYSKEYNF